MILTCFIKLFLYLLIFLVRSFIDKLYLASLTATGIVICIVYWNLKMTELVRTSVKFGYRFQCFRFRILLKPYASGDSAAMLASYALNLYSTTKMDYPSCGSKCVLVDERHLNGRMVLRISEDLALFSQTEFESYEIIKVASLFLCIQEVFC